MWLEFWGTPGRMEGWVGVQWVACAGNARETIAPGKREIFHLKRHYSGIVMESLEFRKMAKHLGHSLH